MVTESNFCSKPQTLTREQLHVLVWATPRTRLAKSFGLSDVGFSKLCKRAEVPCPPRGYWTRLALGQPVEQIPLPPPSREAPPVVIEPAAARTPFDAAFWAEHKSLRASFADVAVPSLLERPHKALAGQVQVIATDSFTATSLKQRRLRIIDTIFRQAERMGFNAKAADGNAAWLEYGLHRIDLQLRQHVKQVRRPLENSRSRFIIDLQPTGLLSLKMGCPARLPWKPVWIEQPSALLESSIGDILATLAITKALLDKRREEDERETALFEAEAEAITEREEKREREEQAWEHFLALAEKSTKAQSVRAFIAQLESLPHAEGGDALLAWARHRLAVYDPLDAGGSPLWRDLGSERALSGPK